MRLSPILYRQRHIRMFKLKWKTKSNRIINDYGVPEDLKDLNVKVYDALEVARPKKEIPRMEPPDPYKRNLYLLNGPGNPNWHDEHVYLFDRNSMLIEGFHQSKVLTKTVEYEGFPKALSNAPSEISDLEIDDLLQHCILESALWDGIQEKLPKRVHPVKLVWNYRRVFGVSHNRKILSILNKFLSLCERIAARNNSIASRMQVLAPTTKLHINIYGKPVLFESLNDPLASPDILLSSSKPLPSLFSSDEVKETVNEKIPDMTPLLPVISLEKINIFTEEKIYPLNKDKYPHTLFVTNNTLDKWTPSQKYARIHGLSFAYAASHAQLLYGEKVKELPRPIVIQSIWVDEPSVGFCSFQLNTLDLETTDGIKNQIYLDGPYDLYQECNIKSGLVGYNGEVFRKMLAMYLCGI